VIEQTFRGGGVQPAIFTIGHSNHTPEKLANLLLANGVEVILDVRSAPYSKFSPQFNRERLAKALHPLRYAFMGDTLGGRPEGDEFYDEAGHVLYGPLSRSASFLRGLEQVERNAQKYRIALLCSEADPGSCHRFLLISRSLRSRGFDPGAIRHILGDGSTRGEAEIGFQGLMLEDSWRSPLSVSPGRAPSHSSAG
jgi:uncharacterized protein (DUF488 family)